MTDSPLPPGIASFTDEATLAALQAPLTEWLPAQRWFAGKARSVTSVRVRDLALLDARVADLLVDVDYSDGVVETYQVPVALVPTDRPASGAILPLDDGAVVDALTDAHSCHLLAALAARGGRRHTNGGLVLAGAAVTGRAPEAGDTPRPLGAEQSNSSVVFGQRYIMKLFRKLEQGVNPDVELTGGLTRGGFTHVPAQHASLHLTAPEMPDVALAVLSDFIAGAPDGWTAALEEVASVAEGGDPPPATPLLDRLDALGATIAEAHTALAGVFGAREAAPADVAAWVGEMHRQTDEVLALAAAIARGPAEKVLARWSQIHERFDELLALPDAGKTVRIHGDLHLGQVLLAPSDGGWQLIDFEGEPARPMADRRERQPGLRDVAGMLRSLDYAAAAADNMPDAGSAPVLAWRDRARERLLSGYLAAVDPALLPAQPHTQRALLDGLELQKAVYELGYELANRPSWVPIPAGGILRILEADRLQ